MRKLNILSLIFIFIIIAIPTGLYLAHTLSPTYDDALINAVESGASESELVTMIENHSETSEEYLKSVMNASKETDLYKYKIGDISKEESDKLIKSKQISINKSLDGLEKIKSIQIAYIKGQITKEKFLSTVKTYYLSTPELQSIGDMTVTGY
jgi:hypothetical protein